MDEFDFIRCHLSPLAGEGAYNLRDDAARLSGGWVISTDTSIAGVHFPTAVKGAAVAERAVRVAASDLAAKAAAPHGYLVNLALPRELDEKWLIALAAGFGDAQAALGLRLLGGDTTRHDGPLAVTVTVIGTEERTILREGARAGDELWVSGTIGDGLLGLRHLQGEGGLDAPTGADIFQMEEAFLRPVPRFDLRGLLIEHASASIDISDGLVADAKHIATASSVGLEIDATAIPLSPTTSKWTTDEDRLIDVMTAGDDYEVLFTASFGVDLSIHGCTRIGSVVEGSSVRVVRADRSIIPIGRSGYTH